MGSDSKRLTVEYIIEMTKKLKRGEKVICPLCERGTMESVIENFEVSNCFVCSFCREKLNIN